MLEQTAQWRAVRATITSGSLVRLAALQKTGLFDERLFIDSVDHDFCLRSRARGLLVVEASDQVMDHSLGNITRHRFFWRTVNCTNHSPLRRYYITRNQLEAIRRHLFHRPGMDDPRRLPPGYASLATISCMNRSEHGWSPRWRRACVTSCYDDLGPPGAPEPRAGCGTPPFA